MSKTAVAHPASYPVGTRDHSLGEKWLGCEADLSPPSSAEIKECMELYLHSPNTPSCCGAQLKKSTGITVPLPLPFTFIRDAHEKRNWITLSFINLYTELVKY
jgi:hypothetical protein